MPSAALYPSSRAVVAVWPVSTCLVVEALGRIAFQNQPSGVDAHRSARDDGASRVSDLLERVGVQGGDPGLITGILAAEDHLEFFLA